MVEETKSFIELAMEFIDKVAPLLYILVPAIAGVIYKLRTKVKNKEKEVTAHNIAKNKELYSVWEHEESKTVISKIKGFCNLYKDKGNVDLVQYLQLENGTVATSKIQNMFLTCLAEDDRFGAVPKLISKLQRMPYSECATWIEHMEAAISSGKECFGTLDLSTAEYNRMKLEEAEGKVGSVLIAPVIDENEILLGMCVFYYHKPNYNGSDPANEWAQLMKFKGSVENTLFVYHQNRIRKKESLGIADV